jgi:RND family efflux transporter MFP subunit
MTATKAQSSLLRKLIASALLAGPLAPCIGCTPAAPATAGQPIPEVTVVEVVTQETIDFDDYMGQTEASEIVEVRARVNGFLQSVDFTDGDMVTEGQDLFTIEPDEYDAIHKQSLAQIAIWESKLQLAKANLARNEKLVASNAVSREEYEETLAQVREAEASIVAAKADANRTALDVKYTKVKAPISGRVDRAYVSRGNLVTGGLGSGTLLTKLVKEQPMYVYFDVDERSLLRYRKRPAEEEQTPGSLRERKIDCLVQLADESDYPHKGTLDFAANAVTTTTGTIRVRGVFPNDDHALTSGLFVRVRIPVSEPYQAILIPERAIATDQNLKFVYVVNAEKAAERRNVELGGQRGDLRIITSGLQAGDQVVVKGLQRIRPGQKVEPQLEQTP